MFGSSQSLVPVVTATTTSAVSASVNIMKPVVSGIAYVGGDWALSKVMKRPSNALFSSHTAISAGKQFAASYLSDTTHELVMSYAPLQMKAVIGNYSTPILTAGYKQGLDYVLGERKSWSDIAVDALISAGSDILAMQVSN